MQYAPTNIIYVNLLTDDLFNFIHEHADDDAVTLVLEASRYPEVNIRLAANQIEARQRLKEKLPSWYENIRLYFPSPLSVEQCSSELTAVYKQKLIQPEDVICDLTGGLGVDTFFLSRKAKRVAYIERNKAYCDAAIYNMGQLKASNVTVLHADAVDSLKQNTSADVYYLDPARRGIGNKRMFALEDCEPDLTKIWSALCAKRARIIVKLSPMFDINRVLHQLPNLTEIHVVSVKNECKELLAVADYPANRDIFPQKDVRIHCINLASSREELSFQCDYEAEKSAIVQIAHHIERYLYEPNASLLKAGVYRTISERFELKKLHVNSHLYTSENDLTTFPGRRFEVTDVYSFDNHLCKGLSAKIPKANLTVRNFPLSVDELRKRTRIVDGGDVYLFATTLSDNRKAIIRCLKASGT